MSKISVTTIAGLTSGGDANKVKIESGDTLQVESNATVGGTLGVTGNATMGGTAAITGNTTVGGTLGVTGATTLANSGSAVPLSIATHVSNHELAFTGSTHANIAANNGANPFYIQSIGAGSINLQTTSTDRMVINASGHVTMASQPYVTFQGSSGGNTNITHGEYFGNTTQGNPAFSTSGSNLARMQGITYNSSNGLFTVPTGGLYMIYFQGYYNASATVVRVDIICNGVQMALGHMDSTVGTVNTSFAGTLAANDTVGFRMISGSSGTVQDWYMGPAHMLGYIVKVA